MIYKLVLNGKIIHWSRKKERIEKLYAIYRASGFDVTII